jgi:hapalindole-type alkaloid chlorinase
MAAFLSILDAHVDTLDRLPDALGDMHAGRLGVLIARQFLPAPVPATVLARLAGDAIRFPWRTVDPAARLRVSGRGLGDVPTADLSAYVAEAELFQDSVARLFDGLPALGPRVHEVFSRVSGGRRVDVARTGDGRSYLPLTIRRLAEGGTLPPHFELQVLASRSYGELAATIDAQTIMSFVIQLAPSESGGDLCVHDLRWSEAEARALAQAGGDLSALLTGRAVARLELAPGDLAIFDSGRFAHGVSPVAGSSPRWTMGGFLAIGRAGDRVLYWS